MKLIDKSALVAEIDKITKALYRQNPDEFGDETQFLAAAEIGTLNLIKDIIDTLEVNEVDLDGISRHYALNNSPWDNCVDEIQDAYKAGFELGLKAQKL